MSKGYIVRTFDVSSNTVTVADVWFYDYTAAIDDAKTKSSVPRMYAEVVDLTSNEVIVKFRRLK